MSTIGSYTTLGSVAERNFTTANNATAASMERITSGSRINRAADDAAGLAVAQKMQAQITGISQYSKNAQDAVNYTRVADDALGSVNKMLTRMKELSVQSANGTYTDDQRALLQEEFVSLRDEIDRLGQATKFNGQQIFKSSEFSTAIGDGASGRISFKLGELSSKALGLDTVDLTTQKGAGAATELMDRVTDSVTKTRSVLGATENRLSSAIDYMAVAEENTTSSLSRISDTNYLKEITNLQRSEVLSQVSTYMMKQSQTMMQTGLLSLLK